MPSYADAIAESRRICILRILESQAEYSANDAVLQITLEGFGFAESRDAVRTDIAWLSEQGVLAYKVVGESVIVAQLTARGVDVAKGRATVPGIQRPSPRL